MRIAVLLGLVARQRHQPGFGLRRDDWFFARPWPILDRRQRPIAQRPLHAALNRLMVNPNSLPHRTERRILAIGQQHLRPRYPARRLGSRPRKSRQSFNLFAGHCQFNCSPPSCHDAAPRFANRKTRNPPSIHRFHEMQVSWNRSSRCRNGPAFASIARLVAVPQNDGVEPESERSAPSIIKGTAMEHYAGIDVSLEESSVCIVDATGTIVREVKIASEPAVLVRYFDELELPVGCIGLEAGPLSQWLHAGLVAAGRDAVLLETRHVKAALSAMTVKTDRKDARGIAQLLRMGWYRPVHAKSVTCKDSRALLVG